MSAARLPPLRRSPRNLARREEEAQAELDERLESQHTGGSTALEVNFLHAVAASDRALSTICSLSGDKVREIISELGPRGNAMKELMRMPGVNSSIRFQPKARSTSI